MVDAAIFANVEHHYFCVACRSTLRLQLRRLMIAPAAVGCKPAQGLHTQGSILASLSAMLPDADRTVSKSPEAIPPRRTVMECASRFPKEHVESIVVGDNFHPMPDAKLRYESAGNELETIAVFRCGRKRYETKQRRDCWRCRTGPCSTARVRPLEAPDPQLEKFLEECHFSDRRLTLYGVRRHSLLLVMKDSLQRRPSRPPRSAVIVLGG